MDDFLGQPAREALGVTVRRCTGTNRNGERCGRAPIVGGFVCVIHGGGTPAVRKTARERLLAMVDPALDALLRFLRAAPPCPVCGRSDADRDPVVLQAAKVVLDRTGYGPQATMELVHPDAAEPLRGLSLTELADRAETVARAARAAADAEQTTRYEDAVLIDDEPEPAA